MSRVVRISKSLDCMPPGVKLARLAVLCKARTLGSAPDPRERLWGRGEDTGSLRRQFRPAGFGAERHREGRRKTTREGRQSRGGGESALVEAPLRRRGWHLFRTGTCSHLFYGDSVTESTCHRAPHNPENDRPRRAAAYRW